MTTVVPTSEEDPALSVVRFTSELAWADAGPEVAEPQVARLCMEAQECMVTGRWLDLASLMLTSANLIFSKVSEKDAYTMGEAKEEAVRTIIEFVKAPDMFQCDLLDMPAVGQLDKDAKHALVYQLLKIFLTQRLDAYLDFHASNSTLLKSYGLVHEDCITKMRLMSLVDLGSDESGQIPYDLIKDTLRINDDEVELWVVKAITAKLIDCKMDQMNQIVIVSRCTERMFGQHQWQTLQTKLATWRGNIANVISTIRANKITEDGSQTMQGLTIR